MPNQEVQTEDRLAKLKRLKALKLQKASLQKKPTRSKPLIGSVNTGLVDIINAPSELINLGAAGIEKLTGLDLPEIDTGGFRQIVADLGLTENPGEEGDSVANKAARFFGASLLPSGGLLAKGAQKLAGVATPLLSKTGSAVRAGRLSEVATPLVSVAGKPVSTQSSTIAGLSPAISASVKTAQTPLATVGIDAISSLGAAAGGKVGENVSDDPSVVALFELGGGLLTPIAALSSPKLAAKAIRGVKQTLVPFTKVGAEPRAAKRLQSLSADPEAAAAKIDVELPVSPAKQVGEKRLLALENKVLEDNPVMESQLSEKLKGVIASTREAATDFDGEPNRVRAILQRGKDYIVNLMDVRAATAAQEAQDAVVALGPNASSREMSRTARTSVEAALTDARSVENELWGEIDKTVPAAFNNAKKAYSEIIAARSELDDPKDIPKWIGKIFTDESVTLNDVHAARKRLGQGIAKERGKVTPRRNKIRILTSVYDAALNDMSAANSEGVDTAIAFSRNLNEKFTRGEVGRMLGFTPTGVSRVDPADTLQFIFSGTAPAPKIKQLLTSLKDVPNASPKIKQLLADQPDLKPELKSFFKKLFADQVFRGENLNQNAAKRFMQKWTDKGLFEIFPDIEGQFRETISLSRKAVTLGKRAAIVGKRGGSRTPFSENKSLATLYLDELPGEEMNTLLRAKPKRKFARALVRKMQGDKRAERGLKDSFVEALLNKSRTNTISETGEKLVSGRKFERLLADNTEAMKGLGMTETEINRLNIYAKALKAAESSTNEKAKDILEDTPSFLLQLPARLIGAKGGQRLAGSGSGGGLGSSLVLAQAGSKQAQRLLKRFTMDKAARMLVEAHAATPEGNKLYKALLTASTDTPKKQRAAVKVLNTWMLGVEAETLAEKSPEE